MIVIKINIENIESVSLEICEQLHLDDKYKIPIIKLNMHIILIIHFFIGCSFNFPKYVPQYKIINVTANAKRNNIAIKIGLVFFICSIKYFIFNNVIYFSLLIV